MTGSSEYCMDLDECSQQACPHKHPGAVADVPREKVRALRDRFDQSAKQMVVVDRSYSLGARDAYLQAVRALSELLSDEPS